MVAAHLAQLEKDAADASDEGRQEGCDASASESEHDEDRTPDAPDKRDEEREREARAEARWRRLQGRGRSLRAHEERDEVPMSIPCEGAAMWAELW